jgi:hypothetical protein
VILFLPTAFRVDISFALTIFAPSKPTCRRRGVDSPGYRDLSPISEPCTSPGDDNEHHVTHIPLLVTSPFLLNVHL